jgi:tryptophan synthase alpha chain
LADGPVIQKAGQVALQSGMTVAGALDVAAEIAKEGVPVVLMTYINPVLSRDPRKFAAEAAQAGVTGVIVPDLPIEEAEPVTGWLRAASLDTVFMVAPTTPPDRITTVCSHSSGFVYCVTVTGITGARKELPEGMEDLIDEVKRRTNLPVAAGFGISRPEHMRSLRGRADAAVVGSAIVNEIDQGRDPAALAKQLLRAAGLR